MLPDIFYLQDSKNWIYLVLRLVMITAFTGLLLFLAPRNITNFGSVSDLAYPALTGGATALLIAIVTLIKPIKKYVPFLVILADWVLIATYIYFMPLAGSRDFLLPTGIVLVIAISGIMYVGAIFGTAEAIGTLIVASIAYTSRVDINTSALFDDLTLLIPILFFVILILALNLIWNTVLDENNSRERRNVRQGVENSRKRLQDMRDRSAAVAEMSARLNASLQFENILDAALDLGRMSVREDNAARVVSMALMVTTEENELTIESNRGLQHIELHHTFSGARGVIADAMETGEPIIYDGGSDDPELNVVNSFALVKSTLVIPLRANYETYGVLVYGSTARNAINDDHIDTLKAIGVQATVALHNAVLYNNLREEKERILRIEANGRRALVRDLHDIPTQTVSAVAMHLSTLPTIAERYPERLVDEVNNIRGMALRATEELRHVMFTIRPLSLEASGLKTALDQLAEKMGSTYKQTMQVKIDERIETVLDKDAKGSLFYLIEEAANNARKYAKAPVIQVQGGIQNDSVIIRIRDNGEGFDSDAVGEDYENRGSFGMVNMRERAELINGTFDLQSSPGKGTIVTVRVPIPNKDALDSAPLMKPHKPLRKQYSGPLSPSA